MICKITKGDHFGTLMRYLCRVGGPATGLDGHEKRGDVHVDPHLVAGDTPIMAWYGTDVLSESDARKIGQELGRPSALLARTPTHGALWHASLSVRADERLLSDEEWGAIAQRFVDKMEFTAESSGRSSTPWIALHHGASANGNHHIHIAVSLVREDGTFVNTHRDFQRAMKARRELETEFGLAEIAAERIGVSKQAESQAERQRSLETGVESSRRRLERSVRSVAAVSGSEGEFVRRLRQADLRVRPRFAAGTHDVVVGYSVGLRGPQERMYGGLSLAKDLTLPRLRLRWADEPVAAGLAASEWVAAARSQPPANPGMERYKPSFTDAQIDTVNMGMWRINQRLRATPIDDLPMWSATAQEVSGMLAAMSAQVEGARGGPIHQAMLATARMSETNVCGAPTVRSQRGATINAALLLQQAAAGGGGDRPRIATAIMIAAMVDAVVAMHEAATAMKQAHIAEALARDGEQTLRRLLAELPALPPRPVDRPITMQEALAVPQAQLRGSPVPPAHRGRTTPAATQAHGRE